MKTDTIAAWQVEEGDLITLGSDAVFEVVDIDENDGIQLMLKDDDGECECFMFTADDDIQLVVSLDDDDENEVDSPL